MSNFCQGADSGENLIWDHKSCSQRWFCKLMTICLMIKTCCQEWKWSQQSLLYLSNNQIYRMQNFKGYGKFPLSVWCIPDKDAWHWQHKAALFIQDYQLLLVITNIVLASVMNFSETVPRTNINKILRGIYLCVGRIMCCDHFINCLSLRHTEH